MLDGRLADQAALIGILNALWSMGLTVLSLECLDPHFQFSSAKVLTI